MTTNRTPGRWVVTSGIEIHAVAAPVYGGGFAPRYIGSTASGTGYVHEDYANAAFIVKACNAHDELVAALEEINRIALGHPYAGVTCGEVARAAIARANGEA